MVEKVNIIKITVLYIGLSFFFGGVPILYDSV